MISPSASNKANSDHEVMAALSLTESLMKKLDLILARQTMTTERLTKLDEKMDELNQTVKGLKSWPLKKSGSLLKEIVPI